MGVFESVTLHRLSDANSLLVGGGRDVGGDVSVVGVGQLQSVAVDSCARRGECKVAERRNMRGKREQQGSAGDASSTWGHAHPSRDSGRKPLTC